MDNKNYTITKLDGMNYFIWKLKVEMLLQKEKIWDVIEEEPPEPITPAWISKDRSARATIGLTLEDRVLITTANCSTASAMWNFLRDNYEHKGMASRLFLLKKLYGSNYSLHNNMEDYINGIQETVERLRSIGEEIKEPHLIAIVLCGLPQKFNPLITSLESKDGDDLKVSYVMERLRGEATRNENQDSLNTDRDTAMAANYSYGKRQIICHLCNRPGHIRRNCPQLRPKSPQLGYNQESTKHNTYCTNEEHQLQTAHQDEWALNVTAEQPEGYTWLVDSGASSHMTPDLKNLRELVELSEPILVNIANGKQLKATGEGKMDLWIKPKHHDKPAVLKLSKVLYVPELSHNLVSVAALCEMGLSIHFFQHYAEIKLDENVIGTCHKEHKNYILHQVTDSTKLHEANICIHMWHARLAHRSLASIRKMMSDKVTKDLSVENCKHSDFCPSCQMGSMRQKTFSPSDNHTTKIFGILVTDVCGPITPNTFGGGKYMLTLTDEASNYTHVEVMKNKGETSGLIQNFIMEGHNKFGRFPEVLRSDEGGEYLSCELRQFLRTHGIIHQTSVTYTPQQNGRAERKNLTLMNMTRSMLCSSGLPKGLWGEAVVTATHILNRLNHSAQTKSPFEMWHGVKPVINHLRSYGCQAYAFVSKKLRQKLDCTAQAGYLVGYGRNKKCYRIWVPGGHRIINAISVTFDENEHYKSNLGHNPDVHNRDVLLEWGSDNEISEPGDLSGNILRRSTRTNFGKPPIKLTY